VSFKPNMTCETKGSEFAYKYIAIIGYQFGFLADEDGNLWPDPVTFEPTSLVIPGQKREVGLRWVW